MATNSYACIKLLAVDQDQSAVLGSAHVVAAWEMHPLTARYMHGAALHQYVVTDDPDLPSWSRLFESRADALEYARTLGEYLTITLSAFVN